MLLHSGETGLRMDCAAQADNIAVVTRANLREPEPGQRTLSHSKICKLTSLVRTAMGCPDTISTAEK